MYADHTHKRDIPHKVRFNRTLDRILSKAANRAQMQHATYLHELIEWAVENGAIEALSKEGTESSAA